MITIYKFAKVTEWDNRLRTLAAIVEPERWDYRTVPSKFVLPVLRNYIEQTFIRAKDQQKLSKSERLLCFNTGLLTMGQEEVFGVFTANEKFDVKKPEGPTNHKWRFKTWSAASDRSLTDLIELPSLAEYWTDASNLIFNPSIPVLPQIDHIVRENLSRFPEELGGKVNISGVPMDLEDQDEEEDEMVADPSQPDTYVVPLAAKNALEGAIKHSVRLAQRSYRIAVPQFHKGTLQLLLPLYLRNSERPDLALTLERMGGWYRAATVLYPDWAYRHARLLARPNSEWLGGFREGTQG